MSDCCFDFQSTADPFKTKRKAEVERRLSGFNSSIYASFLMEVDKVDLLLVEQDMLGTSLAKEPVSDFLEDMTILAYSLGADDKGDVSRG